MLCELRALVIILFQEYKTLRLDQRLFPKISVYVFYFRMTRELFFLIFFCFIIPARGMQNALEIEPEELQENTPLKKSSNRTPSAFECLSDDPFWKIIFDNLEPLTQEDIWHLACTSTTFHTRIGTLTPKVILSRFPTILQYLKALSAIEQAEKTYQLLFTKYPEQMSYLDGYETQVKRLLVAEAYMRFSPWFKVNSGSRRTHDLARIHNIDISEDDRHWLDKIRCMLSAITRDPLVVTGIALATIGATTLLGIEINKNQTFYNENYLKNLNYTNSPEFVDDQMHSECPGCQDYYFPTYPSCFIDFTYAPLTCWNRTTICAGGRVNNPLLQEAIHTTIQQLFNIITELNKTWSINLPSLNYADINNTISPNFIPFCTQGTLHDAFLGRLKNSTLLIQSYIQGVNGLNTTSFGCQYEPFSPTVGTWAVALHNYYPHCIATSMTPHATLDSLISGVFFFQATIVIIFVIGWSMTF